jgi:hypothetical protein
MTLNVGKELAALERMSVGELRARYAELFAETTAARNRRWLIKRIIWRMQSVEQGGLSDRARERAKELAQRSDLRVTAPKDHQPVTETTPTTKTVACRIADGSRTPLPGTLITRIYKGQLIQVQVLANGFEYEGEVYRSLSAVAKQITGSHWNGFKFFNLQQTEEA